jgi:transcriptional regulator with XRE-family HTH domain
MKNLKELRELKRFTQIEMAIECGISLSTYRLIEYGAQKPNPEVLKKLEKLLME